MPLRTSRQATWGKVPFPLQLFNSTVPRSIGNNPLFLVDLDGDGLIDIVKGDLVSASASGAIAYPLCDDLRNPWLPTCLNYSWSVRMNQGGSWGPKQQFLAFDGHYYAPLTGSPYDAFITNNGSGPNTLYFGSQWASNNDGTHAFITRRYVGVSLDSSGALQTTTDDPITGFPMTAFADMNGDGIEDSVDYDYATQTLCITKWGQGDETDWLNATAKSCWTCPQN